MRLIVDVRSAYGVTRNLPFVQDRKDCRTGSSGLSDPSGERQKPMADIVRHFEGSVIHVGVHHECAAPVLQEFLQVILGSADCNMIVLYVAFVV